MEHWNMESEMETILDYIIKFDEEYWGKKSYTMADIQNELNLESVTGAISDEERKELADKDNRSWYTNNLNKMFGALFDCEYKEVLVREGKSYKIGEKGRIFIRYLLRSYGSKEGKKLVSKKYKDVDIQYECYLFYYATEFLKELGEQDEKKKEMGAALAGTLMQKFDIDNGTRELMKSFIAFKQMIEDILKEDGLEAKQKDIMHRKAAENMDGFAKYLLSELSKMC